jgi:hypothetical protein
VCRGGDAQTERRLKPEEVVHIQMLVVEVHTQMLVAVVGSVDDRGRWRRSNRLGWRRRKIFNLLFINIRGFLDCPLLDSTIARAVDFAPSL